MASLLYSCQILARWRLCCLCYSTFQSITFFACDIWLFIVYVLLFTDSLITDLSHYMDDIVFFDIWYPLILIKYLIFLNQPDYYSANLPQCLQIFFHSKKLFLFLCSVQLLFLFSMRCLCFFLAKKSATVSPAI